MKHQYVYKGKILKIIDGDTVDAIIDLGFKMTMTLRLRLLGIDTPELNDPDALERIKAQDAKSWLYAKLFDQFVYIKTEKSDSFGRYLAEIYFDGQENSVNFQMLTEGIAAPYSSRH